MDDRQLFVALADAGSFARTGRQLGISRSTVMRRLDALEDTLGVTLVQRAGRRIALTPAGRQYAAELRPVLQSLARVEQSLREAEGSLSGRLRIWLPMLGTSAFLAPAVAAFQTAFPEVVVELELGRDVRHLEIGTFDVAIQLGLRVNPQLRARTLYRERLILVASASYVARAGLPESLADLARHRIIQARDLEGRPVPWRLPDGARIAMPRATTLVNSVGFAFELAREGAGVARAPAMLATPSIQAGEMLHVVPDVWSEDPVSFVFAPDPTPITRTFVDWMVRRPVGAGLVTP